jgi:hypothetical protein
LPPFHAHLLAEGRTKRGTEAVLAQALRLAEDSDDPGLIYVLPELVQDIMGCKYDLGWDTSYHNCHGGLSTFAVPHMFLKHQQEERLLYQDWLGKASTTTISDSRKARKAQAPRPNRTPQMLAVAVELHQIVIRSSRQSEGSLARSRGHLP